MKNIGTKMHNEYESQRAIRREFNRVGVRIFYVVSIIFLVGVMLAILLEIFNQ
jgi:uncharacterized membrane protein YidH (DUF202 family)